MSMELSAAVLAPDNYCYRERQWRAPPVEEGEEIIFDEPGRVLGRDENGRNGVCCRSHYFRVTKPQFGRFMLRVRHGGGDRSFELDYNRLAIDGMALMDSDSRYRLLWMLLKVHQDAASEAATETAQKYRRAFVEGRLRKRKIRGQEAYKVEIVS